jgi:hypothetical protein
MKIWGCGQDFSGSRHNKVEGLFVWNNGNSNFTESWAYLFIGIRKFKASWLRKFDNVPLQSIYHKFIISRHIEFWIKINKEPWRSKWFSLLDCWEWQISTHLPCHVFCHHWHQNYYRNTKDTFRSLTCSYLSCLNMRHRLIDPFHVCCITDFSEYDKTIHSLTPKVFST